eukprot:302635-Rhodomonas_salina.1
MLESAALQISSSTRPQRPHRQLGWTTDARILAPLSHTWQRIQCKSVVVATSCLNCTADKDEHEDSITRRALPKGHHALLNSGHGEIKHVHRLALHSSHSKIIIIIIVNNMSPTRVGVPR